MGKHGLVTWAETSEQCYSNTLRIIGEAQAYLDAHATEVKFGGQRVEPLPAEEAKVILAKVLPGIRGKLSESRPWITQLDLSPEAVEFVSSNGAADLCSIGAACPDHLVHTKRLPLYIDWSPEEGADALATKAAEGIDRFKTDYTVYFDQNKGETDVMFSPSPRIILIPGIGMICAGPDAQLADVSRQLYRRAIVVMGSGKPFGEFCLPQRG